MIHKHAWLTINLSTQTSALERLLGCIRRRGFQIENMMVTNNQYTHGYRIEVRVVGQRCFSTLARHVANLVDVSTVSLLASNQPIDFQTAVSA